MMTNTFLGEVTYARLAPWPRVDTRVWGAAEQKTGIRVCPARLRGKKMSQIKHIFPDGLSEAAA